ncbi:MAG: heavy-metal-associated domain-containing protein [Chloroflexota bacterium]
MITKSYRLPDMHCSACAMRLEAIEDQLAGIGSIRASYHRQSLVVEFDPAQVTEEALLESIRSLGYTPIPL